MKFVVLAIFAIFVAQSFHIAWKILVTFAIFAKFADISKPFLTFSLSKCSISLNLLFLLFLLHLFSAQSFHLARKIPVLRFLRNLRTSRSPSWPFLFVKVEFWKIFYSCYFCHIVTQSFHIARKILLTFATFAIFSILFW